MKNNMEILKSTTIFRDLRDDELKMLLDATAERDYARGDTIIKMMETGDSMYIIKSGGVNIYFKGDDGDEFMMRHLKTGEVFGEMAMFDNEPRSALVKATDSTTVFEISKDAFFKLLEDGFGKDSIRNVLMAFIMKLSQRLRFTSSDLFISMESGRQLTQDEIDALKPELVDRDA